MRELHKSIRQVFCEVLGLAGDEVGINAPLERLGMSSIDALKVAERLESALGVPVAPNIFFDCANISELAQKLARSLPRGGAEAPDAARPSETPDVPATPAPAQGRSREEKIEAILRLLGGGANANGHGPQATPPAVAARPDPSATPSSPRPHGPMTFSILFFSDKGDERGADKYGFVIDATRFADRQGFEAVWIPERHFHPFGGIYPSPATLASYLAAVTDKIRLRSGSVVLPLEHPARVVEAWAMVDNLSGGRVDMAVASGWNPNDFILAPENYGNLRGLWLERIASVRALWRGEALSFPNGLGVETPVVTYPRPLQKELSVWLTASSRADSFVHAGQAGLNVLTMLLNSNVDDLTEKIRLYRQARAEHGHDPEAGVVTLMLHTFVHPDEGYVRETVREPFLAYIRNALDSHTKTLRRPEEVTEHQKDRLAEYSYERYYQTASLLGSPEQCLQRLRSIEAAGVNEVACLLDFGVEPAVVLGNLHHLVGLKRSYQEARGRAATTSPAPEAKAGTNGAGARPSSPAQGRPQAEPARAAPTHAAAGAEPIAVVGMAGRFPGSSDLDDFWKHLKAGRELISEPAEERCRSGGHTPGRRAGWVADVTSFDPLLFGISPREAAHIDPHHRVLLETVWEAVEAAGYDPSALSGSQTGVFVSVYNHDYLELLIRSGATLDPQGVLGSTHSLLPNRLSYLLDLHGPSELVDTACSSSLVALHRAVKALRNDECDLALVGGVSLMLTSARLEGLDSLGILATDGCCRAFDSESTGQVMGEGAGVVLLKPLRRALEEGDTVYGIIRGTAVNHQGRLSGSLTMPSSHAQIDVIRQALKDAGLGPETIGYIEAHGAGGPSDLTELGAFTAVFCEDAPTNRAPCAVGSAKPNIGFLEAAGGMAGLIKALLCLRHRVLPASINFREAPPGVDLGGRPLYVPQETREWKATTTPDGNAAPRRASVHAYGLGGVNAHVILEEAVEEAGPRAATEAVEPRAEGELFLLSARSEERLTAYVRRWLAFLDDPTRSERLRLEDVAYTVQTGRPSLNVRLALIVRSLPELKEALRRFLERSQEEDGSQYYSRVEGHRLRFAGWGDDPAFREYVRSVARERDLGKLAALWVDGFRVDWAPLHEGSRRRRLSLPTYPFLRQSFDLPVPRETACAASQVKDEAAGGIGPAAVGDRNERESVEVRLRDILSEVLRIPGPEIDLRRPFADYGLDSFLSMEVMKRLQDLFGPSVPTVAILENPDGMSLVGYLAGRVAGRHFEQTSSLVGVRTNGTAAPSFWVHGSPGSVAWVNRLAAGLGQDYPVYGLKAKGLGRGERPLASVEDLAASYVGEIRRVQEVGPYVVGGYSFGGTVAFEAARQLHAQGERVSHLVLIDSYAPGSRALKAAQERSDRSLRLLMCANMLGSIWQSRQMVTAEFIAEVEAADPFGAVAEHLIQYGHPPLSLDDLRELLRNTERIMEVNLEAERRYEAQPLRDGATQTILFRAQSFVSSTNVFRLPLVELPELDHAEVWARLLAGPLVVYDIPCDHFSLTLDPYIAGITGCLKAWLAGKPAAPRAAEVTPSA